MSAIKAQEGTGCSSTSIILLKMLSVYEKNNTHCFK